MNDMPAETLRRTPLHDEHVAAGAKMVPFAGFEMPIQYPTGITAEHQAVRRAVGLFDVSHMGEFEVTGPQALDLIQYVTTNDASVLTVGQAQYSTLPRALRGASPISTILAFLGSVGSTSPNALPTIFSYCPTRGHE